MGGAASRLHSWERWDSSPRPPRAAPRTGAPRARAPQGGAPGKWGQRKGAAWAHWLFGWIWGETGTAVKSTRTESRINPHRASSPRHQLTRANPPLGRPRSRVSTARKKRSSEARVSANPLLVSPSAAPARSTGNGQQDDHRARHRPRGIARLPVRAASGALGEGGARARRLRQVECHSGDRVHRGELGAAADGRGPCLLHYCQTEPRKGACRRRCRARRARRCARGGRRRQGRGRRSDGSGARRGLNGPRRGACRSD